MDWRLWVIQRRSYARQPGLRPGDIEYPVGRKENSFESSPAGKASIAEVALGCHRGLGGVLKK